MKLALAWNRCDVARSKIMTVENRNEWQKPDNNAILYESLFLALTGDGSEEDR